MKPGRELDLLDTHIKEWRKVEQCSRTIDSIDALQQLRLEIAGELLPIDDGSYVIRDISTEVSTIHATTKEAQARYKEINNASG